VKAAETTSSQKAYCPTAVFAAQVVSMIMSLETKPAKPIGISST